MYNKVIAKLANILVYPVLMLGACTGAFASGEANYNKVLTKSQLEKTLVTAQQKRQFSFISRKLIESHLPKELAIIPVIESHYNQRAVSGKGAAGLWQLMVATAKEYGISDQERFELEASTIAALNYFNVLHQKFGNWEFAIAAYNAGDGRVRKALRKKPTARSVQELALPQETKQYVQKFYQMQGELNSYTV